MEFFKQLNIFSEENITEEELDAEIARLEGNVDKMREEDAKEYRIRKKKERLRELKKERVHKELKNDPYLNTAKNILVFSGKALKAFFDWLVPPDAPPPKSLSHTMPHEDDVVKKGKKELKEIQEDISDEEKNLERDVKPVETDIEKTKEMVRKALGG